MAIQNGKAHTIKTAFSRKTSVQIDIRADAAIVWSLLTNGADLPRWNSTILAFQGHIKPGEKIELKSTLDPKRTFKLTVEALENEKSLIWGSGMLPFFRGQRIYTLTPKAPGMVTFHMTEKISGLMFPLAAGQIPPFDANFEQFAADLKKEAEIIQR